MDYLTAWPACPNITVKDLMLLDTLSACLYSEPQQYNVPTFAIGIASIPLGSLGVKVQNSTLKKEEKKKKKTFSVTEKTIITLLFYDLYF